MARDNEHSVLGGSRLTRAFILLQSVIIVALSVWLYKEYVSNQYLQLYLAGLFQGQGSVITLLGVGGLIVTVFVGVLLKAGGILGEIEQLSSRVEDQRANVPAVVETFSMMPTLEVVDTRPIDDLSWIHGSLLRWSERSKRRDRI